MPARAQTYWPHWGFGRGEVYSSPWPWVLTGCWVRRHHVMDGTRAEVDTDSIPHGLDPDSMMDSETIQGTRGRPHEQQNPSRGIVLTTNPDIHAQLDAHRCFWLPVLSFLLWERHMLIVENREKQKKKLKSTVIAVFHDDFYWNSHDFSLSFIFIYAKLRSGSVILQIVKSYWKAWLLIVAWHSVPLIFTT